MKYYYNSRRLLEAGLVKPRPTSTTPFYKLYSTVDNIKRPTQQNSNPSRYDMMAPLCNENNKIFLVATENKCFSPAQVITINKGQGRKEGLEITEGSSSDEPNTMGCHRTTLLSSGKERNNDYMTDHTKKVRLVTPESKFVFHAEVIMTSRYQGRKLGLDIFRISTYNDSDIIGHLRNTLLPDEGGNKVFKPDIDTASKPNIGITK